MPPSRHTIRYKRLQEALKAARKASGQTQAEVGERLGRPQSYVNKYETGERRLDVIEFLDVAEVLGASSADLLRSASRSAGAAPKSKRRSEVRTRQG